MKEIATIGLDPAKNVVQIHGVDAIGIIHMRQRVGRAQVLLFFSRLPPCLVGKEACAGAHYWSRDLARFDHDLRLIPPSFVKRCKTDAADAEAICEASTRPNTRFVPVKTERQQAQSMQYRRHDFLVRKLTQLVNAIRAHRGEFGIAIPKGVPGMGRLIAKLEKTDLPPEARMPLDLLAGRFRDKKHCIDVTTVQLKANAGKRRDRVLSLDCAGH